MSKEVLLYGSVLKKRLNPRGRETYTPNQIQLAKQMYFKQGGKVTKLPQGAAMFPINMDGAIERIESHAVYNGSIGNATEPEENK